MEKAAISKFDSDFWDARMNAVPKSKQIRRSGPQPGIMAPDVFRRSRREMESTLRKALRDAVS